jgi:hypothetical protein
MREVRDIRRYDAYPRRLKHQVRGVRVIGEVREVRVVRELWHMPEIREVSPARLPGQKTRNPAPQHNPCRQCITGARGDSGGCVGSAKQRPSVAPRTRLAAVGP